MTAEPGAASIVIELAAGEITVTHGTDHVVLRRWIANHGDWNRLWDTIETLEAAAL
jgi:hypothetical protein